MLWWDKTVPLGAPVVPYKPQPVITRFYVTTNLIKGLEIII